MKTCPAQALNNWQNAIKAISPEQSLIPFPSVDKEHIQCHDFCSRISSPLSVCQSISPAQGLLSRIWNFSFSILSRLAQHCRKLYNMVMLYSNAKHDSALHNRERYGGIERKMRAMAVV